MKQPHKLQSKGFTLIEVLVAVVVLSIGLLGLAGMQLAGLQNNQSALYRSIATYQAWDMADRLRANSVGIDDGSYDNRAGNPAIDNCISVGCTTAQLANYDISTWNADNDSLLPGGTGTVCRDSDLSTDACEIGGTRFAIRISWVDDRTRQDDPDGGVNRFLYTVQP
ncbi:MAG TPA: type IV pilus modification protein PilV [Chromatiaceae bacterium]|nr:type IV pilus modification protein PilV [Chromatiaceae bacterium]